MVAGRTSVERPVSTPASVASTAARRPPARDAAVTSHAAPSPIGQKSASLNARDAVATSRG